MKYFLYAIWALGNFIIFAAMGLALYSCWDKPLNSFIVILMTSLILEIWQEMGDLKRGIRKKSGNFSKMFKT
jgi:hypothetical protein